jgi:hypothetical protein
MSGQVHDPSTVGACIILEIPQIHMNRQYQSLEGHFQLLMRTTLFLVMALVMVSISATFLSVGTYITYMY